MVAILGWIKKRIDVVIAICVIFEAVQFLLAFPGREMPLIGDFISRNHGIVLGVSSAIVFFVMVFALCLLRIEHIEVNKLHHQLDQDKSSYNQAVSEINSHYEVKLADLERERSDFKMFYDKFNRCSGIYRTIAYENSRSDWGIFHYLFLDVSPDRFIGRKSIDSAISIVKSNIRSILDQAASVYSIHTEDRCSVCIQIIERVDGLTIDDAVVKTIRRDSMSMAQRGMEGGEHHVRDNSLHRSIFVDKEEYVIVNDLAAAIAAGRLRTSSKNFYVHYNAMLIVPIPNLPTAPSYIDVIDQPREHDALPRATLCIDNRKGGFMHPTHVDLARELSERLSVMMYRLDALGRINDRLDALERIGSADQASEGSQERGS